MKKKFQLEVPGGADKVLLHTCCAPCSSAIIECLMQHGVTPVIYYCNPNIYPLEEYIIRKDECTRYAQSLGLEIIDADYDHDAWRCRMAGMEQEPERGGRCLRCFKMRLQETARYAHEHGFPVITTTLASSRWKSLEQIEEAGRYATAPYPDVTYWEQNWRKGVNKADYDQAIFYGRQLFEMGYNERDYNGAVIYSHICLGQAHMMKGNVKEAYSHLGQARLIGESNKNDSALCSVYNGLGLYASNVQKDYYRSLTYFFKGVEAARRCHYDRLYSILLSNIAGIYYLKNDSTGLKYALECYELGHERKDPYLIYSGSTNTAYMYYLKSDYNTALKYIQEAEFTMVQNDFYDQSNVYNLYGYILHKLNKDDEALGFFRKALDLKEQGNISSVMNSYLGYAEILMEHHQYDRAVRMLKAGIELSYQQANAIYRSDLLKALSRCYEEDGMLVEALKYHKLYQLETDSLYNAEKERAVGEIRAKYDMERQENEIKQNRLELLEKENKMQLLIAGFICIFIAASLLYYLYYRKNKLYLTIVKQNQDAIRREQQLQNKIDEQFAEIGRQSALLQEYLTDSTKTSLPQPEKYASSSLTDEKKQDLFLRLETLLREEKVFTDNLLTKEKVAEMLGTNRTYLSQIINEQTKQTFTQFVNGFRTKEAVRSLSDPDNQTPLKAISAELGFNSMTTFYSQFQAATGMTPAQYRNKVQELHKNR